MFFETYQFESPVHSHGLTLELDKFSLNVNVDVSVGTVTPTQLSGGCDPAGRGHMSVFAKPGNSIAIILISRSSPMLAT